MDAARRADALRRPPALPVQVLTVEPGDGVFMDYLRVRWLCPDVIEEHGCAVIRTVLLLMGRN